MYSFSISWNFCVLPKKFAQTINMLFLIHREFLKIIQNEEIFNKNTFPLLLASKLFSSHAQIIVAVSYCTPIQQI